ncbi:MAG TPA: sigma-70 family RNA polymerase sigma factor [Gemmata sp.]|nr:sigma-70 family RNA polymerase sigma factor [Gemmata sp.]
MPTPASMLIKLASDSALSSSSLADTELLQRYAIQRDEAAFAELVRRNGPVVLRACRHVLGEASADDAFQVVFLLLARSAKRLTRPGSLAGWLHAAAVRIAHNARRSESRRRKREAERHPPASSPEDLSWREVREVLDTEIAALPESYRLPLVLCYIQELTHEEAARRSGCPVGVFRGRLERGRERLRKRLARYGLPVAAPVLVLGSAQPVSAALVGSTIRSTRAGTTNGVVPSAIANLLHPTAQARFTLLLAPTLAALTAFGMVLGAVCGSSDDQPPAEPSRPQTPITAADTKPQPTDILGDPLPPGALARLGSARFQHDDMITGIVVSADGKLVASRGRRPVNFYRLFEGETGRPVPLCDELMKADLRSIRYTIAPYKNTLAAIVRDSNKKESRLLNPITGEVIRQLPWGAGIVFFSHISPDGKTVATFRRENKDGQVKSLIGIWNADSNVQTDHELVGDTFPGSDKPFQFSADSKVLACHAGNGEIRVWGLPALNLLFHRPSRDKPQREEFALSPDGKLLAHTDREMNKIRIWDLGTGKELPDLPDQSKEVGWGVLAFSWDGKILAGLTPWEGIRLWDLASNKKLRDTQASGIGVPRGLVGVTQVVFSSDGKRLYAADGDRISVLDPTTGKPLDDYGGHHYSIESAAWSPDGKHLASTAVLDNYVSTWDAATGRKLLDLSGHKWIESLTYSPDGSLLATGSQDGIARLWDTTTGKELHSFAAKDGNVHALAFTPDGKLLVTGGDKALHVWDLAGRKEARTIPNTGTPIQQITFLGGGQRILTQDISHAIRILDFATGREFFQFSDKGDLPLNAAVSPNVAISPDERYAAHPLKNGKIRLSDLSTGRELRVLATPTNMTDNSQNLEIVGLAFSPDGRTLAAAYWQDHRSQTVAYWLGDVRVFEVATGSERFRFTGHADCPLGVAFSPDGTRLCSYGGDRTLLIWDVTGTRLASTPPPKNVNAAWADLASQDAGRGFAAVRYLAADPGSAIRLATERVKPVAAADPKVVAGLIGKLSSNEFKVRESASMELAALAPGAVDQILKAAQETNSPEVRARLEAILPSGNGAALQGEQLHGARVVEVLERIASPDARKLLGALAKGTPDAILTREAAGAVRRLGGGK